MKERVNDYTCDRYHDLIDWLCSCLADLYIVILVMLGQYHGIEISRFQFEVTHMLEWQKL